MADQRTARVPRLEIACSPAARVCRALGAPTRVTIGSSSISDFRIAARGVRARHVVIDWDGRALVVVEINGPLLVNGRSVEAPFPIIGAACLLVADAAIWVTVPPLTDDPPTPLSSNEAETLPNPPTHSEAPVSATNEGPARWASRLITAAVRAARDSCEWLSSSPVSRVVVGLVVVAAFAAAAWRLRSLLSH